GRLSLEQAVEILDQTALQTGLFFESGLAETIATDLCRHGACLPLDLQIVARAVVDLRLTSVRRYERSGGAELLTNVFFERIAAEAGGKPARRVLLHLAETHGSQAQDIATHTRLPRPVVEQALSTFAARGLVFKREHERERDDRYQLAHPALS